METVWLVYISAVIFLSLALFFSKDKRRTAFAIFILSLQVGATYYAFFAGSQGVGGTAPDGIAIHLATLSALLFLFTDWCYGESEQQKHWAKEVTVPAALLLLTSAITIFYSPERWRVVYYLLEITQLYLIFFVALNCIRTREDVRFVVRLLMIVLFTQSVIYFTQSLSGVTFTAVGDVIQEGGLGRYGGTIATRPAPFASFIEPLLLIAIAKYLSSNGESGRFRTALLCGIGTCAFIMTFTRAAWMGFAIGMVWLIVLGTKRRIIRPGRLVPLAALGLLVLLPLLPKVLIRISNDYSAAYEERMNLSEMAWNVIEAHPVLGVGAGAYGYTFRDYLSPELQDNWLKIAHNVYLLRWAETGIVGLIPFVLLFLLGLRRSVACTADSKDEFAVLALGWSAGLVGLMWEMMWDTTLGFPTDSLIWFLFGLMLSVKRLQPKTVSFRTRFEGVREPRWAPQEMRRYER